MNPWEIILSESDVLEEKDERESAFEWIEMKWPSILVLEDTVVVSVDESPASDFDDTFEVNAPQSAADSDKCESEVHVVHQ